MSTLEENVKGLSFLNMLLHVLENGELGYWEKLDNPPNLSVDEFKLAKNKKILCWSRST